MTTTGVQASHLPDLKEKNIQRGLRMFASRGNRSRRDASLCDSDDEEEPSTSDLTAELASIWKDAVRHVLEQLGLLGRKVPPQRLPRMQLYDQRESGSVRYALHYVVLHYRRIPGNSMAVATWAPFIHLGC